jgi:predicted  nucleic acid-binding Zn-ribbon protein
MMKRMISWARLVGAFICLLGSATPIFSKEVVLEEVSISLYNKPVTGFRLVLDRSERFVANQVIDHVADSDNTSPFQYERSIIYENIRYEPIVSDRDISLYFLLKSIQGQYTELTVVAMYDYRRAISTREFPELALRLKIDLAKLVRHLTGDVMQSGDIVYDDATLAKFDAGAQPPAPNKNPDPQPMADHFKLEEVDNPNVLLRKDPFKVDPTPASQSQDTAVQRLMARIQQLEQREQAWQNTERTLRNEQATLERKQEVMQQKVKDNKALKDSIVLLNQRVEALISHAYVADDVSVSNETAAEIAALEKENARYKRQAVVLNKENDSLRRVATSYGEQLNRLAAGGKSAAEQLADLQTENKALQKQVEALQTREALGSGGIHGADVADSLLSLLANAQLQTEALRNENENQNRSLGRLKQENDELSGKKMQLEERMATLESENRTLRQGNAEVLAQMPDENLIDSLNGEIRAARRSASISKAELTQVRTDMEALQNEKDAQERQLVAARSEQKNLQARIDGLLAANGEGGTQAPNVSSQRTDSLLLLRQQLKKAEALAANAEENRESLTRSQTQLQTKERELSTAQAKLQEKTTELAEIQKSKGALQKSLADANAKLTEYQNAKGSSQQEVDRLNQENRSLKTDVTSKDAQIGKTTAENKSLNDSILAVRTQRTTLRKDIEVRDRNVLRQKVAIDSLQSQIFLQANRENDLKRSIYALESRVDSLARVRVPEGEQARYLKEQRSKLDQLQKELDSRDVATKDKEKLLAQRESVLQRRETEFAAQDDRFKDLEERERRLQMLEQQLNAREGLGSVDATPVQVREGKVMEFGNQIPVYIVESGLGVKAIQRQVVGYMLSRDELLDDQFPEVLYRTAHLGELDSEPVELKIRIDSKASGTILQISMRLTNGDYLGSERYRERNDAAKQLISKMLRYKI